LVWTENNTRSWLYCLRYSTELLSIAHAHKQEIGLEGTYRSRVCH